MQQKGWSANEWAVKSGTSPTNITRFLAPTSTIMPSGATIAKLARTAGSQPKLSMYQGYATKNSCTVPCANAVLVAGFEVQEFWKWIMDEHHAPENMAVVEGPMERPAFVCNVPDLGMVGRGLLQGDRVLVEDFKPKELSPGQLVLARLNGRVTILDWRPPLALFHPSPDKSGDAQFQPVKTSELEVYGRVTRLLRDL